MDLLGYFLGGDTQATWAPDDDRWYQPTPGVMSEAGVRINADTAKKISAWYRGRDILATVLAMLPFQVLERLPDDGGAVPAVDEPLYDILHDQPNTWQDSFQWRRQQMYHLIDHGNGINRIVPGVRGFVDQLHPIDPTLVKARQLSTGRIVYDVRDPKTNVTSTLTQDEVFHLRGASDDGIWGRGILEYARTSLGTAAATESYAARIFSRGMLNGGTIEIPGVLDGDASKRMATSYVTAAGDWHLPVVLEQGSKYNPPKLSPEDFQMLDSRKFTVDDVARWLGMPRLMLENSDPSFGNAEQFTRNFMDINMGPWLALWEFAGNAQLILQPKRFFTRFNRFAIIRSDIAATATADVAYVNAGIRSVDEIRSQHDWNTRGGKADELREPQNITGKPKAAPSAEPPAKPNTERAEAIATESAARLLRKEIASVSALAVKHAADEDAFVAGVTAFYVKHAELVAQSLQIPATEAEGYCAGQCQQLIVGPWYAALDLWKQPQYAAGVAAMVLESAA